MYEISNHNVVTVPLKAFKGILNIVWWIVYVVVADETIVVLAVWVLQDYIPSVFLEISVAQSHMKFVLVKPFQFLRNLLVLVEPKVEVVALVYQFHNALNHPLLPERERCHEN